MIQILKLKTKIGKIFYSIDHSPELIMAALKHCPDWKSMTLISMAEDEYYHIPATNEAIELFKKIVKND